MAESQVAKFQFGPQGLITKEAANLLKDGQYRSISNVEAKQEGSLSTRAGRRSLGGPLPGPSLAYGIQKLVETTGENPLLPSTNPRYIGAANVLGQTGLYRTTDYNSFTEVAPNINSAGNYARKSFRMASFAAGNVGGSWAFIASELQMLKDNGASPYSATLPNGNILHNWGILPAAGVALVAAYNATAISGVIVSLTFANGEDDSLVPTGTWTLLGGSGSGANGGFGSTIRSGDGAGSLTSIAIIQGGTGYTYASPPTHLLFTGGGVLFYNASLSNSTTLVFGASPGSVVTFTLGGTGNLNGGNDYSSNLSVPYDYRYTFVASDTNNEGNPSQTMLSDNAASQAGFSGDLLTYSGQPVSVLFQAVKVLVYGSSDPQIGSINIYRRGGLLYDAWRLVGTVANPVITSPPTQVAFIDNVSDVDLEPNNLLVTDNDPPVPSAPPTPITGNFSAAITTPGWVTVTLQQNYGSLVGVTAGTLMHLYYDNPEDVIVQKVVSSGPAGTIGANKFIAFFQHTHSAYPQGAFEVDTICNQPCFTVIPYQQFLLIAGDPNNPHYIYRTKGDQPEAVAVAPADGSVAVAAAGTPSNPIQDLCSFRGQIVSLNLYGIFETLVLDGSLVQPVQVANRGLVTRRAWCQTDTEIWFLATDGVYSWDGGNLRKRSEAIDNIFHGGGVSPVKGGQTVNQFLPLNGSNWGACFMEAVRGEIHLIYDDVNGTSWRLICEPRFNDRWKPFSSATGTAALYTEPDTGSMIEAAFGLSGVTFSMYDQEVISPPSIPLVFSNLTSDFFTSDPTTQGVPIPFSISLPWFDFGSPESQKLLEEALLDLDFSGNTGTATLSIDVLLNYSDTAVNTIAVLGGPECPVPPSGRSLVSLLPGMVNNTPPRVYGQQGNSFSYRIYGQAYPARMTFYSLVTRYQITGEQTGGAATDWTNLGAKFDKKLYQMTVEFDTQGVDQTIYMDTVSGRDSTVYTENYQSFALTNPTITGSGRAQKTFPVADDTIVKEVRLRPGGPTTGGFTNGVAVTQMFRILSVEFEKEVFPPDVVSFTPREDGGYEYDKYANQLDLEVNTNNVVVMVNVQADGSSVWAFSVATTEKDRRINITLPPGLIGKQWRLFIDPAQTAIAAGGGMFQLFSHRFSFQKADKADVIHSGDWDDLGHGFDKYLRTVTVEWDLSLAPTGTSVILQLDIVNGIGGGTLVSNVGQFTLTGDRSKCTFPIAVDSIAKLIRLYPITTPLPIGFKQWKYTFDKTDYPADIIFSTEWKAAQSPNEENPTWVWVDMDTAGVPCACQLMNETGDVFPFTHTGSVDSRKNSYPIPADTFGKMWRLILTPGANGKAQVFAYGLSRWAPFTEQSSEAPPYSLLWTPWRDAETNNDKNPTWVWVDADTAGTPVSVQLVNETGSAFTFTHTGTVDARKRNYAIPVDLFGKMWRLLVAPAAKFQCFGWGLQRWAPFEEGGAVDPPDQVLWTPWVDMGWPFDKIARSLILTVDTEGSSAVVYLQTGESGTVATFPVSTTYDNRRLVISCPSDLIGKQWRLVVVPTGSFKLWNWQLDAVKEPAAMTVFDSYEQTLGYKFWKLQKQLWLKYACAGLVNVTLTTDTGSYSFQLPVHLTRATERVLLPSVFGSGLNKTKTWRLQITAFQSPFKFYQQGSGLEFLPLGSDRHACYKEMTISEMMTLGEGGG